VALDDWCRCRSPLAVPPTRIPPAIPPLAHALLEHRPAVVAASRQRRSRRSADPDSFVGRPVAGRMDQRAARRHRFGVGLSPAADSPGRSRRAAPAGAAARPGRRHRAAKRAGVGLSAEKSESQDRHENPHIHLRGIEKRSIEPTH